MSTHLHLQVNGRFLLSLYHRTTERAAFKYPKCYLTVNTFSGLSCRHQYAIIGVKGNTLVTSWCVFSVLLSPNITLQKKKSQWKEAIKRSRKMRTMMTTTIEATLLLATQIPRQLSWWRCQCLIQIMLKWWYFWLASLLISYYCFPHFLFFPLSPVFKHTLAHAQTEELVKALQDLENAASGDAAVRQKIASLPQEVQDVSLLEKITGKAWTAQLGCGQNCW